MSVNLTTFVVLEEDQKMAKRYSFIHFYVL